MAKRKAQPITDLDAAYIAYCENLFDDPEEQERHEARCNRLRAATGCDVVEAAEAVIWSLLAWADLAECERKGGK